MYRDTFYVNDIFDTSRLLPHLECYSLITANTALIRSKESRLTFAHREDGRIRCDCLGYRKTGTCVHQQALEKGGLWDFLKWIPRGVSLVTWTLMWSESPPPPNFGTHLQSGN